MITEKLKQEFLVALEKAESALLMPVYISEIEKLVSDPKASAQDICEILDKEQDLSRLMLNTANSPFYNIPKRATSTIHAVQAIGFEEVIAVARCHAVYALFATDRSSLPEKIITHGSAVGAAAVMVSAHLKLKHTADIFLAGLVHDIGKVFMSVFMPDKFEKLLLVLNDPENLLGYHKLEEMIFGVTHSDAGAGLLEKTGFAKNIIDAVSYHHACSHEGPYPLYSAIVHIADAICNIKGLTPFKGLTFPLVEPALLLPLQDVKKEFGTADMTFLADGVEIEIERLRPFVAALR